MSTLSTALNLGTFAFALAGAGSQVGAAMVAGGLGVGQVGLAIAEAVGEQPSLISLGSIASTGFAGLRIGQDGSVLNTKLDVDGELKATQ